MKKLLLLGLLGWGFLFGNVFALESVSNPDVTSTFSTTQKNGMGFVAFSDVIVDGVFYYSNVTCTHLLIGQIDTDTPLYLSQNILYSGNVQSTGLNVYLTGGYFYFFIAYNLDGSSCDTTFGYSNTRFYSVFSSVSYTNKSLFLVYGFQNGLSPVNYWSNIKEVTFDVVSTVDYPEIFFNNSQIATEQSNDYYINWTGGGTNNYGTDYLTITGEYQTLNSIIQGLSNLNYTGYSFNIGTELNPYVESGVFYVPNFEAVGFSGEYTYIEPLTISGVLYTGTVFGNFTDSVGKLFLGNLTAILWFFGALLIGLFLFNLFRFRRK